MGMPKAAVLPVPVRAWPRMSTPASARGMSSDWISEGVTKLSTASARRMDGRTPSAAKASGSGGCSVLSLMKGRSLRKMRGADCIDAGEQRQQHGRFNDQLERLHAGGAGRRGGGAHGEAQGV